LNDYISSLQVSINGLISFNVPVDSFTPEPFPLDDYIIIAPFWGDVDTTGTGTIHYRESTSTELLNRASTEIRDAFPLQATNGFTATSLFIATWDHVGFFDARTDLVRTEYECACYVARQNISVYELVLHFRQTLSNAFLPVMGYSHLQYFYMLMEKFSGPLEMHLMERMV